MQSINRRQCKAGDTCRVKKLCTGNQPGAIPGIAGPKIGFKYKMRYPAICQRNPPGLTFVWRRRKKRRREKFGGRRGFKYSRAGALR